jgi:hypothetical protein
MAIGLTIPNPSTNKLLTESGHEGAGLEFLSQPPSQEWLKDLLKKNNSPQEREAWLSGTLLSLCSHPLNGEYHGGWADVLIKEGANPKASFSTVVRYHQLHTSTAIHYACANGKPEVISVLLSHGASATELNGSGESPLHLLVLSQNRKISEPLDPNIKGAMLNLIRHGANPKQHNAMGLTPLAKINESERKEILGYWAARKATRELKKARMKNAESPEL